MDVDLCHSMDALFMRIKDQEDTLLAVSSLSSMRCTKDITDKVMCRIHEESRQHCFRSPIMLASSSSMNTGYAYRVSDIKSKRKPIHPCQHCGSEWHYDYDCSSYKKDPDHTKPITSSKREATYHKAYIAMTAGTEEVYQAALMAAHKALSSKEEDEEFSAMFAVPEELPLEGTA
jgi:hypothetical protein